MTFVVVLHAGGGDGQRAEVHHVPVGIEGVRGPRAEERVETWPDGTVRVRYEVDESGRRHGAFEEFLADGTLVRIALRMPFGPDETLKSIDVKPVTIREQLKLSFTLHHQTRDLTQNQRAADPQSLDRKVTGGDPSFGHDKRGARLD